MLANDLATANLGRVQADDRNASAVWSATLIVLALFGSIGCNPINKPVVGPAEAAGEGSSADPNLGSDPNASNPQAGNTSAAPTGAGGSGVSSGQGTAAQSGGAVAGNGSGAKAGAGASGGVSGSGASGGRSGVAADGGSSAAGAGAGGPSAGGAAARPGPCPAGRSPDVEQCDAIDNDCDGKVDEELMMDCGSSMLGICHYGKQTCSAGIWTDCFGAVEPAEELCDSQMLDENCDGASNEGCQCTSGEQVGCGKDSGICQKGTQLCVDGMLGKCMGAVDPQPREICEGSLDEDCDDKVDEDCTCTNGKSEVCMPAGSCAPGMRTCKDGNWGQCMGSTTCASNKICDQGQCVDCRNGEKRDCGQALKTPCKQGTQMCRGGRWDTTCDGEKGPSEDVCNGIDDNCDGTTDNGCPSSQQCMPYGSGQECSLTTLPNGSYRNSCNSCVYDGKTLKCSSCNNGTGKAPPSQLNPSSCTSGQIIANCYGALSCRDPESKVLQGSYVNSCSLCFYDECQLHCDHCDDGVGNSPAATLMDLPCAAGISNCLGRLTCGGC